MKVKIKHKLKILDINFVETSRQEKFKSKITTEDKNKSSKGRKKRMKKQSQSAKHTLFIEKSQQNFISTTSQLPLS